MRDSDLFQKGREIRSLGVQRYTNPDLVNKKGNHAKNFCKGT